MLPVLLLALFIHLAHLAYQVSKLCELVNALREEFKATACIECRRRTEMMSAERDFNNGLTHQITLDLMPHLRPLHPVHLPTSPSPPPPLALAPFSPPPTPFLSPVYVDMPLLPSYPLALMPTNSHPPTPPLTPLSPHPSSPPSSSSSPSAPTSSSSFFPSTFPPPLYSSPSLTTLLTSSSPSTSSSPHHIPSSSSSSSPSSSSPHPRRFEVYLSSSHLRAFLHGRIHDHGEPRMTSTTPLLPRRLSLFARPREEEGEEVVEEEDVEEEEEDLIFDMDLEE